MRAGPKVLALDMNVKSCGKNAVIIVQKTKCNQWLNTLMKVSS